MAQLACLLFGTVCGNAMAASRVPQSPVRVLVVTIARGALQDFLEQLRSFADADAFALRAGQSSPDPEKILIQMWREDIKVIGVNTSEAGAADITYSIALYRTCGDDVPEWAFDRVIARLREVLGETEGVTSQEKE
jgi:hypothetical protein